jgi:hypothetical protein
MGMIILTSIDEDKRSGRGGLMQVEDPAMPFD